LPASRKFQGFDREQPNAGGLFRGFWG